MIDTENKTFYMVFVEGRNEPSQRHYEIEMAVNEAKRLCEKEGKKSYILQAFFGYEPVAKAFNFKRFQKEEIRSPIY
jgi:hypothetical protein